MKLFKFVKKWIVRIFGGDFYYWFNTSHYGSWGPEMLSNIRENKDVIFHDVKQTTACCKDMPVLLIGAGPSLKEQADDIRELSNKMMTVCCDRAYIKCIQNAIKVHMVVTGDPRAKPVSGHEPVIIPIYANPVFVDKWIGPKIWYSDRVDHPFCDKMLKVLGKEITGFSSGGNVMSVAYIWALKFAKANTIIFAGNDYCNPDPDINNGDISSKVTLLNHLGDRVYSSYNYLNYTNWFHDNMAEYHRLYNINHIKLKNDKTIFGYTADNLPVEGMEHLTKEEIILWLDKRSSSTAA